METRSVNSYRNEKEEIVDGSNKEAVYTDKEADVENKSELEEEDSPIEEVRAVVPK